MIYLRPFRRDDLSVEFGIDFRRRKLLRRKESERLACIVLLAIKNSRVLHGACDPCLPVQGVSAEILPASICIDKLQDGPECTLLSVHPDRAGRYDLVRPPAWSHLCRQNIVLTENVRNVVCICNLCLHKMSEPGFEHLSADHLSVDIQLIDTETGSHPSGRLDLAGRTHLRDEPACAIRRPLPCTYRAGNDRSIRHGDPAGVFPRRIIKGFSQYHISMTATGDGYERDKRCQKKQDRKTSHRIRI